MMVDGVTNYIVSTAIFIGSNSKRLNGNFMKMLRVSLLSAIAVAIADGVVGVITHPLAKVAGV